MDKINLKGSSNEIEKGIGVIDKHTPPPLQPEQIDVMVEDVLTMTEIPQEWSRVKVCQSTRFQENTEREGIVDIVYGYKCFKYGNVNNIPFNGKLPKNIWGIHYLYSDEALIILE